jgi:hypothetical protein
LLQLKVNYQFGDHWNVHLGANYNHISNGGAKRPNKGMNFPTVSFGLDYTIRPAKLSPRPKSRGILESGLKKYARLFSNIRTVDGNDSTAEKQEILIGLEGGIIGAITNINALLGGIEFWYDGLINEEINRGYLTGSPFVFSISAGHAFIFGRYSFTQQIAWYAYNTNPTSDSSFFQRYAMYWLFGKNISAGFSLKAHGHVAEYMDIRLGAVF